MDRPPWPPETAVRDYHGPYPLLELNQARKTLIDMLLYSNVGEIVERVKPKIGLRSRFGPALHPPPVESIPSPQPPQFVTAHKPTTVSTSTQNYPSQVPGRMVQPTAAYTPTSPPNFTAYNRTSATTSPLGQPAPVPSPVRASLVENNPIPQPQFVVNSNVTNPARQPSRLPPAETQAGVGLTTPPYPLTDGLTTPPYPLTDGRNSSTAAPLMTYPNPSPVENHSQSQLMNYQLSPPIAPLFSPVNRNERSVPYPESGINESNQYQTPNAQMNGPSLGGGQDPSSLNYVRHPGFQTIQSLTPPSPAKRRVSLRESMSYTNDRWSTDGWTTESPRRVRSKSEGMDLTTSGDSGLGHSSPNMITPFELKFQAGGDAGDSDLRTSTPLSSVNFVSLSNLVILKDRESPNRSLASQATGAPPKLNMQRYIEKQQAMGNSNAIPSIWNNSMTDSGAEIDLPLKRKTDSPPDASAKRQKKTSLTYKCDFCTFHCKVKPTLEDHLTNAQHFSGSIYNAVEAEKGLDLISIEKMLAVKNTHSKTKTLVVVCPECRSIYEDIFMCAMHYKFRHGSQNGYYAICPIIYHATVTVTQEPKCTKCGQQFTQQRQLNIHWDKFKDHHPVEKPPNDKVFALFICPYCRKNFYEDFLCCKSHVLNHAEVGDRRSGTSAIEVKHILVPMRKHELPPFNTNNHTDGISDELFILKNMHHHLKQEAGTKSKVHDIRARIRHLNLLQRGFAQT